jgi:type II secretory pathway pseudopilin PulG
VRRGVTLLEIVVVLSICTLILLPVMNLSQQNMNDEQELQERSIANGLCLDAMERLKRYKPYWALPGADAAPPYNTAGPAITELFMPLELILKRATVFDQTYVAQIKALGMELEPDIKRTTDPELMGLFKLEIGTRWTNKKGHAREVRFVRYCFAP